MRLFKLSILFFFVVTLSTTKSTAQRIDYQGISAQQEGSIAYPANGHLVPRNLVANQVIRAYSNIASVDEDPNNRINGARAGAHFTNIASDFRNLARTLQQNANLSLSNLKVSFTPMSLGADRQGQDWLVNGTVETRHYQNGTAKLKYNNTLIATAQVPRFTITIDYRNTNRNGDEVISGQTGFVALQFVNNLNGDAATIASALQRDLGANCRVKFVHESMESAFADATHGLFEAQAGHMLAECNVNQAEEGDNNNNNNNSADNNAKKCRVTGIVANNANMRQTVAGAEVIFKNTATNLTYRARANRVGRYNIHVPRGTYLVQCRTAGYSAYSKRKIVDCVNKANPKLPYETHNVLLLKKSSGKKCRVTGIVANNANMKQTFAGKKVIFTNTKTKQKYTAIATKAGRYNIHVPKGTYAVSCKVLGFKPYLKKVLVNCINEANRKLPYETHNVLLVK